MPGEEVETWNGIPLKTRAPGRWDKGREWDGMGDWCDPVTAQECCTEAERVAWSEQDMDLTQVCMCAACVHSWG